MTSVSRMLGFMFLVTCCAAPAAWPEDRRADKSHLKLMTYNAEFLWDGVEPEQGGPDVNFGHKGDKVLAEKHMAKVAQVIIANDPDVLNLCEVEHLATLKYFNDTFLAGRGYKAYLKEGGDTATGQDVGLLTRIDPVSEPKFDQRKGVSGEVSKSVTKNYVARFETEGLKFSLIAAHLLAHPSSEGNRFKREAQAQALRSMAIDEAAAGYEVALVGDFNDFDWEASARDHKDSQPISNVLAILRNMKLANTVQDDLYNVAAEIPKGQRYTAFWDKNKDNQVQAPDELSSLDHILVSSKLRAAINVADIPHTTPAGDVSDHFPVVVRFNTPAGADGAPSSPVRVVSLLPNPFGDESQKEAATLQNFSAAGVNLAGWKLKDPTGKVWKLDGLGTLAAGEAKTILRDGQPMGLSNGGDTIDLVSAAGAIVQTVVYPSFVDDEGDTFEPEPAISPLAAEVSPAPAGQLMLGALNIEWLGRPGSRTGSGKNHPQDKGDIASYIKASGVAILALEEISDTDGNASTRSNQTLDAAFGELNAGGAANWKYRLFQKHKDADKPDDQQTGIAWNEALVTPVGEEFRLDLKVPQGENVGTPDKPAFERWATAMKFSAGAGKADLVVIPVHLKSNRPAFPGQNVVHQRVVEARMLLAALAAVQQKFDDEDIVILGDSNVMKADEATISEFTSAAYVDLNAADLLTYGTAGSGKPFDRAFVPSTLGNPEAGEFENSKLDVFMHPAMNAAEFRKKVSDHRMIRITVDVSSDND